MNPKKSFLYSSGKEATLAVLILVLLFFIVNPGTIFMPTMIHITLALVLLICVGLFGVFIFKERVRDEREQLHRLLAGRYAFLVTAAILVSGLIMQTLFTHRVDPWLAFALGGMVIAKIIGRIWAEHSA